MFLRRIVLRSFRNFSNLELNFPKGIILLKGGNAQGKSNLLEAIHFLSLFKSYRAREDSDLINKQGRKAYIRGEVSREGRIYIIECYIGEEGKTIKVDYKFRKVGEAMGRFVAILYRDEDKEIIKGEPAKRRDYLDDELSLLFPRYRDALASFRKVLAQRNTLLKGGATREEMEPWNEEFAQLSSILVKMRKQFIFELLPFFQEMHQKITEGREKAWLRYSQTTGETREEILNDLRKIEEEEREKGMSLIGPQRDDVEIGIDDMDARYFSSLGQARTLALSLRLAQFLYSKRILGDSPVFLFDDLTSDLEEERRKKIGEILRDIEQVFIATTEKHLFPLPIDMEVELKEGTIARISHSSTK
ncbi:MAG: DNA replication/repair protein RecF [bacterium]